MQRKRSRPTLSYYPDIYLEQLRRTTKYLSHDSRAEIEPGTSRIRNTSTIHSTGKLGSMHSEPR